MDVAEMCSAFGLGKPTGPPTYVARGELGRVSWLTTTAGIWAVKELELFVPTVDEADATVDLQESMLAAGLHLPRPRRTVDGHGLFANTRVYEWLDLTPVRADDLDAEGLVAGSLACIHIHASSTERAPDPWYCETMARDGWDALTAQGAGSWWAGVVAGLVDELADVPRPAHSPARICHLACAPRTCSCATAG